MQKGGRKGGKKRGKKRKGDKEGRGQGGREGDSGLSSGTLNISSGQTEVGKTRCVLSPPSSAPRDALVLLLGSVFLVRSLSKMLLGRPGSCC